VWVVTAGVLGLLALGMTGPDANGLQSKDSFRTEPEAVTARSAAAAPSTSTSCAPPATTETWWYRWC
jgi:hypothetical protein